MAEWLSRAVDGLREVAGRWGLDAVGSHPAWTSLWETAASPVGIAFITTVFATLGLGILVGYLWARPRVTAADAHPSGGEPLEPRPAPSADAPADRARPDIPEAPSPTTAAAATLQSVLRQRDLSPAALEARLAAFTAELPATRTTLAELAAEADVDDQAPGMIAEARHGLERGDLDAVVDALERTRSRFGLLSHRLAEDAARRRLAAVRAGVLAGELEMAQCRFATAARRFGRARELVPEKERDALASLLTKQATALFQDGALGDADDLLQQALKIAEDAHGGAHPDVAKALSRLAFVRYTAGNPADAEALYRRALAIDETMLGDDHPQVAADLANLAQLLLRQGNAEAAEPLLKRALAIRRETAPPTHPEVLRTARMYANLLHQLKRPEAAKQVLADSALARRQATERQDPMVGPTPSVSS